MIVFSMVVKLQVVNQTMALTVCESHCKQSCTVLSLEIAIYATLTPDPFFADPIKTEEVEIASFPYSYFIRYSNTAVKFSNKGLSQIACL